MSTATIKRVNISLPQTTLEKIDALTEPGNRSRFIDQAVHFYVEAVGRKQLRQSLKEGALQNNNRDTNIAAQWFHIDESVWQNKQ
jgi:metal-responsive CopG/Arc/MetJ family transcriptional regulator